MMKTQTTPTTEFTPILRGKRVKMLISQADERKISPRGLGRKGIVKDLRTGKRYEVFGRACTLRTCYCDAEVVLLEKTK